MTTQPEPDSLRQRIAKAIDDGDSHSCMYQEGIDADGLADAVLAVVQPVIDEVDLLRRGATERADLLEEARDALSAAGQNGAHGDDWPNIAPSIRALSERARKAEAMTAEVIDALRLANRELDAAATKWDADLDKRTADLTERASNAEAALARVRELVADMQGVTGARWWADQLTTALAPPVPADNPEGGAQ